MIKNLSTYFPYLLIIGIYFFFVNIEAQNKHNFFKDKTYDIDNEISIKEDIQFNKKNQRISIPIIPYDK